MRRIAVAATAPRRTAPTSSPRADGSRTYDLYAETAALDATK